MTCPALYVPDSNTGAVGAGIVTFFDRRGQRAINPPDAALPGKLIVPPKMTSALRKLDKIN